MCIRDSIRCEGWNRYTKIYLVSGACIVSSYNIGLFKDMLENYDFFQPHRSHLINKNNIQNYSKGGDIMMSDGSSVPLARRKKEEFHANFVKIQKRNDR